MKRARSQSSGSSIVGAPVYLLCICACCGTALAKDWPTYRHDNSRSGITAEALDVAALREQWVYESPYPPQPAWPGPAKWDSFASIIGLSAMRNYDPVFHVIVAGQSLYFGSSSEDAVRCLDVETGAEKWTRCVDGAVRIAPTYAGGKLYFGADDGCAYCVNASDGTLVWKYAPSEDRRLIPSNGKLVSLWPCRTGVLVDCATAYFAMALLPWRESYLCAVDAKTGEPSGPHSYRKTLEGVTMEGALLASPAKLYVPQGRSAPLVFDRQTGKRLGALEGGGGVFAVLTPDAHIVHGPGNKTGWITESDAESRDKVASFNGARCMVVTRKRAYILMDDKLIAIDRATKRKEWASPCEHPYTLILAGRALLAGGNGEVAAFAKGNGERLCTKQVKGRAYGLAVANGRLFASTDTGAIHCFE